MPLPFLVSNQRKQDGITTEFRKSDTENEETSEEDQALEQCAQDLITAVEQKDKKATADALRSAFDLLDSQPHEEGPHINEEDGEEG